jgi:hypothetical protein
MLPDLPVWYSPTLGVWAVDHGQTSPTISPTQTLGAAMHYAKESGELDGCVCWPEQSADDGPRGIQTTPPRVHVIFRRGGFLVAGHGQGSVGLELQCPHYDAAGETRARELIEAKDMNGLQALCTRFPSVPAALAPAEPGTDAPDAWVGEPMTFDAAGVVEVPGRHVHPDTRADLARLAALAERAARTHRDAVEAQRLADAAPADARRLVADAAGQGHEIDADAITRRGRELAEHAASAQAVADGTTLAVGKLRAEVADGIAARREGWLAYLAAHGAASLGRLDLVLLELDAVLADLREVDAVRQAVTTPDAKRLFADGSPIGAGALDAIRAARQSAAETLAPLGRHAARAKARKTPARR